MPEICLILDSVFSSLLPSEVTQSKSDLFSTWGPFLVKCFKVARNRNQLIQAKWRLVCCMLENSREVKNHEGGSHSGSGVLGNWSFKTFTLLHRHPTGPCTSLLFPLLDWVNCMTPRMVNCHNWFLKTLFLIFVFLIFSLPHPLSLFPFPFHPIDSCFNVFGIVLIYAWIFTNI